MQPLTALFAAMVVGICLTGNDSSVKGPATIPIEGCPNVWAATPKLLSGGAPDGEVAFKALADAGVKTIITVDGARPDVEGARKHGIRYVHIPIGYDGVTHEQTLRLARAVRDLPGKIYIHCHHGKHRSPAALASVLVGIEGWPNEQAINFMKSAGTSERYIGLYDDVRNASQLDDAAVEKVDASFPEIAQVPDLVEMMVAVEHRLDALAAAKAAGWARPKEHPDIVPAHEALQLEELFREGSRLGTTRTEADYRDWMDTSEGAARALQAALKANDRVGAESSYQTLVSTCTACHERYRNARK